MRGWQGRRRRKAQGKITATKNAAPPTPDMDKVQLVKYARRVERLVGQRRVARRRLRVIEEDVRAARRFLAALAMPTPEPMNHGERGDLLPGEA
jgi:hypothetical protein